jgi:MFS family permease
MTMKGTPRTISRSYAHSLLAVLFGINLLNYIDRLVIAGLLEPIGKDLRLTDAQLGQVGLAFLCTYSILPPLLGWVADRARRTRLIAAAVIIWSSATALAGATRGLLQLAATRAIAGAGEATYMTTAPSVIADIFPAAGRGKAMSLFYIASPVGAALGVMLAGVLASAYGWRAACLIVGLPGILMAVPLLLFREPIRGGLDPDQSAERPSIAVAFRELRRNRLFLLLMLAYTVQTFGYNAVEFWLPTLLQRDKAISLLTANTSYGVVVLAGGFLGPLIGATWGDLLAKRRSGAYYWVCASSALMSVAPILSFAAIARGTWLFGAVFMEILLGNMSTGLVFALLVTVVVPGLRSTATAVMLTGMHVFGDAISQPLIGYVSTKLHEAPGSLGILTRLTALVGIPPHHTLSVALVGVVIPATLISVALYILAMPGFTSSSRVANANT